MKTKYVLVSQGIKIDETYDKEEAERRMNTANEEWYEYVQRCVDNYEPYADNEVFMYEVEDMNNVEFQKQLKELYDKYLMSTKREHRTFNELVFALRMSGENYQISITEEKIPNGCGCIPGIQDTFIPVKDLAKKVISVEFDEEIYNDYGIKLLLVVLEE